MKRIFPDTIEAYNKFGVYSSLSEAMEDKLYQEYLDLCPTIQEFFCRVSNKKAIEAGVKMDLVSKSKKSANKKKIITFRRIMNLFRIIPSRQPNKKDPAPSWTRVSYGLYGTDNNGYPCGIWLEYLWNPLDVFVGSILDIVDDAPYQLAIAISDLYRKTRWKEFCELSKNVSFISRLPTTSS